MPVTLEVGYFNSFYMKRLAGLPKGSGLSSSTYTAPTPAVVQEDWYVEESRIRGGFNNTQVDLLPGDFSSKEKLMRNLTYLI